MNDPEAFEKFVGTMPAELRPALMDGDNCSTAFYAALRRGWSLETLIGDMRFRTKNGSLGPGGVIAALRKVAEAQPPRAQVVRLRKAYVAPTNVVRIPPEWAGERAALMRRIREEGMTPDEGALAMDQLQAEQRARGLRAVT